MQLGAQYPFPKDVWPEICRCVLSRFRGQPLLPMIDEDIVTEADRIVRALLKRHGDRLISARLVSQDTARWRLIDINDQEQMDSRTVGVEQLALWALHELKFAELLMQLGLTRAMRRAIIGQIVGRMAHPASDRETYRWLRDDSALGEFLGFNYELTSLQQMYRASDKLVEHQKSIEAHLYDRSLQLFNTGPTVTLLDLTNTYLEGTGDSQELAKRGHSKEKRFDCPLITLALVLDGNGFVQRSRVYPGNVCEFSTLEAMLADLEVPPEALLVMDRGMSTEENLTWLRANDYKYLVVDRRQAREFDAEQAVEIGTRKGDKVQIQCIEQDDERILYCRSWARVEKENAMLKRKMEDFQSQLKDISDGLQRPRTRKKLPFVSERIGRLKQTFSMVSKHYKVTVVPDEDKLKAIRIDWELKPQSHSKLTHPGVYGLRTNVTQHSEGDLWHLYVMLTDVEAAFRSFKSELGLRPVRHHKDKRTQGHLFITVLAYQMVHLIRGRLRQTAQLRHAWTTIRNLMQSQVRTTRVLKCKDGSVIHSRLTDKPDRAQAGLYRALNLKPCLLGIKNTTIPKPR